MKTRRSILSVLFGVLLIFGSLAWTGCGPVETCTGDADCNSSSHHCVSGLCRPLTGDHSCKYGGKIYKVGDSFPSTDGCNNCTCSKGGAVACTKKACANQCGGIAGLKCKGADEYCNYAGGTCGAADQMGTCAKKPQACTEQYDPVCGCDGKTYGNACSAASAGVSVARKGECKPTGTCKYNGKTYKAGDSFPSTDGCNTCSCGKDGSVPCTKRACATPCGGLAGLKCPEKDQFCEYSIKAQCGAADATGICKKKPQACTDHIEWVCGCDGKSYSNPCEAHAVGVSVAATGKCASGSTCTYGGKTYKAGDTFPSTDGCNTCSCGKDGSVACTQRACAKQCGGIAGLQCKGADEYCSYPGGTCGVADRMGTCAKKPQACTQQYDPVCGCDGKTYGNACTAASSGMSVDYKGECKPAGTCTYNGKTYKAGDSFPSTDGCNTCTCSKGGAVACTKKACAKQCGGIAGLQCKGADEYCSYPGGTCKVADRMGTCAKKPQACTQQYDPVCGCDGKTYGNACSAASAGMSVDYKGKCKP